MGRLSRRSVALAAAVAAVVAGGAAVVAAPGGPGPGRIRSGPAASSARIRNEAASPLGAPRPPMPPGPALIATLSAGTSYSALPGGPATGSLAATNPFGQHQVLAVVGRPDVSGWLHVELPVRPNGTTAWIAAAAVTLTQTSYRVVVDRRARTLTVTDAGRTVLATPVAVGAPASPTPADQTYVWELIRPDDQNGPYGPYILGLAEFSDTYAVFNGGNAQIGIHGQDEPWSIGQAASHGCVRLPNDVVTELAGMLPLGTPVSIS